MFKSFIDRMLLAYVIIILFLTVVNAPAWIIKIIAVIMCLIYLCFTIPAWGKTNDGEK